MIIRDSDSERFRCLTSRPRTAGPPNAGIGRRGTVAALPRRPCRCTADQGRAEFEPTELEFRLATTWLRLARDQVAGT